MGVRSILSKGGIRGFYQICLGGGGAKVRKFVLSHSRQHFLLNFLKFKGPSLPPLLSRFPTPVARILTQYVCQFQADTINILQTCFGVGINNSQIEVMFETLSCPGYSNILQGNYRPILELHSDYTTRRKFKANAEKGLLGSVLYTGENLCGICLFLGRQGRL